MLITDNDPNNKENSFNKVQLEWYQRAMQPHETLILTVAQLKALHDLAHERGRARERALRNPFRR